jgi:hypothetical protein
MRSNFGFGEFRPRLGLCLLLCCYSRSSGVRRDLIELPLVPRALDLKVGALEGAKAPTGESRDRRETGGA